MTCYQGEIESRKDVLYIIFSLIVFIFFQEILSDVDINTIFAQEFFVGDKKLVAVSNKTASP